VIVRRPVLASWIFATACGRPAPLPTDTAATEVCNGEDDDGDGRTDEGLPTSTWGWVDADEDGFGDDAAGEWVCGGLEGYAGQGGDCDDTRPGVNPAALDSRPTCGDGVDDCTPEPCRYAGAYELAEVSSASWTGLGNFENTSVRVAIVGDVDGDGHADVGMGPWVITAVDAGVQDGPSVALARVFAPGNTVGSFAPGGDVDGDGRDDVLVLGRERPNVPDGRPASAWVISGDLAGEMDATRDGFPMYEPQHLADGDGLGDLDGDGYGEVLLGGGDQTQFGAFLYGGSAAGIPYEPSATVIGEDDGALSMVRWAGRLGDLDGDGRDDFGVSRCSARDAESPNLTCVFTHLPTGNTGFDESTDVYVAPGPGEGSAGIEPAGDLDADGYDDLAVGNYTNYGDGGNLAASIVLGPLRSDVSLLDADARFYAISPYSADHNGAVFTSAGDMDGDGSGDFAISCDREATIYLFYGMRWGAQQLETDADARFSHLTYYQVGSTLAGGADLDRDGYDDLLIPNGMYDGDAGLVFLVSGWAP
jgi:hypothetical protein